MSARSTLSTFYLSFLVGGLGVLALHAIAGFGGHSDDGLFDHGIYEVLMSGASLTVLARGLLVRSQGGAWLAMGAGMLCWSLGDLYYILFLEGPHAVAGFSGADVLYLTFYPCLYIALVLAGQGAPARAAHRPVWTG
jgi:hypothetical protein